VTIRVEVAYGEVFCVSMSEKSGKSLTDRNTRTKGDIGDADASETLVSAALVGGGSLGSNLCRSLSEVNRECNASTEI
jgi:hypothetical protein